MPRPASFEVPTDPTLFGPDQLRPRGLLTLAMRGYATWLATHLVPYSRLVREFRCGTVFTTVRLDHLGRPLRFADADQLVVTTRVQLSESAKYLGLDVDIEGGPAPGGPLSPVARCHADLRVVAILEDALAAMPSTLPDILSACFQPSEISRPIERP